MKKFVIISILTLNIALLSGCGLGTLADRYLTDHTDGTLVEITAAPTPIPERIYMDELSGEVRGFDGYNLYLSSEDTDYLFDISTASIETTHGILRGDRVSIIYEGQLNDADTSGVSVLKVADELNQKDPLTEQSYYGKIISITSNLLIVQGEDNSQYSFSIAGCRSSFSAGLDIDRWIYVHYLGSLPEPSENGSSPISAQMVRVTSLSDTETYAAPAPTNTPLPGEEAAASQLNGTIIRLSGHSLTFHPYGSDQELTADISSVPLFFDGGFCENDSFVITYSGERTEDTSLNGIQLLRITGSDPDNQRASHITSQVTGTVIGTTSDTVTIQTNDGAMILIRTSGVPNRSTGGFAYGSPLRATINPASSRNSNILESLELSDV